MVIFLFLLFRPGVSMSTILKSRIVDDLVYLYIYIYTHILLLLLLCIRRESCPSIARRYKKKYFITSLVKFNFFTVRDDKKQLRVNLVIK